MTNKLITSKGQIQFIGVDDKVINVDPVNIYTRFNEDTVSFMLVALPISSGLSIFTSRDSDLEVDGLVYGIDDLKDVLPRKFAAASGGGGGGGGSVAIKIEVVDVLPVTGETDTIYLVPKKGTATDSYNEYIFVKGQWELIGSTDVKLEDYYTKSEADKKFALKSDVENKQNTLYVEETTLVAD